MTMQTRERIRLDGEDYITDSLPLESAAKVGIEIPRFPRSMTCCWRGYVGHWEVSGGKLFLCKIEEPSILKPATFSFPPPLFSGDGGPVLALWFTGEMHLIHNRKQVSFNSADLYANDRHVEHGGVGFRNFLHNLPKAKPDYRLIIHNGIVVDAKMMEPVPPKPSSRYLDRGNLDDDKPF